MFVIRVLGGNNFSDTVVWRGKEKKCPFIVVCNFQDEVEAYKKEFTALGFKFEVEEIFQNEIVEIQKPATRSDEINVDIREKSRIGVSDRKKADKKENEE